MGLASDIMFLFTSPGVVRGADIPRAKARYALFCRQIVMAIERPEHIVFHAFSGDALRLARATVAPIVRAVPWGPATGKIAVADRLNTCADIALAANLLLETGLSTQADAEFRDFDGDRADRGLGSRCWSRIGATRVALDRSRFEAISTAESMAVISEAYLNGITNYEENTNDQRQ
jgi:hypothetical protein